MKRTRLEAIPIVTKVRMPSGSKFCHHSRIYVIFGEDRMGSISEDNPSRISSYKLVRVSRAITQEACFCNGVGCRVDQNFSNRAHIRRVSPVPASVTGLRTGSCSVTSRQPESRASRCWLPGPVLLEEVSARGSPQCQQKPM